MRGLKDFTETVSGISLHGCNVLLPFRCGRTVSLPSLSLINDCASIVAAQPPLHSHRSGWGAITNREKSCPPSRRYSYQLHCEARTILCVFSRADVAYACYHAQAEEQTRKAPAHVLPPAAICTAPPKSRADDPRVANICYLLDLTRIK